MSVRLLLSAGCGPQECCWALACLLERLETEAGLRKLTTRRVETVAGDHAGTFRSVLLQISRAGAETFAASWTGTLCWQAPSPYRAATGRKNWYVIAQPCPLDTARTTLTESDVDIMACRTGGPGGQNRNKVSTAVRATHRPTGIVVVVDTERHFGLNRRIALDRLRQRLQQRDDAAGRAFTTARRRVHDELVRGNPIRIERPATWAPAPLKRRRLLRPGRAVR
jgi:peptide chain release factor